MTTWAFEDKADSALPGTFDSYSGATAKVYMQSDATVKAEGSASYKGIHELSGYYADCELVKQVSFGYQNEVKWWFRFEQLDTFVGWPMTLLGQLGESWYYDLWFYIDDGTGDLYLTGYGFTNLFVKHLEVSTWYEIDFIFTYAVTGHVRVFVDGILQVDEAVQTSVYDFTAHQVAIGLSSSTGAEEIYYWDDIRFRSFVPGGSWSLVTPG